MGTTVKVSQDFIREALWDRFYVIGGRGRVEEKNLFDKFVELVAECGCGDSQTPSSLVDNWAINGYTGTYQEFVENYIKDEELSKKCEEGELTEEEIEQIEAKIMDKGGDYDREAWLYHI